MKRLHISVSVSDLDKSIGFYSNLFASEPAVVKDDYAKWMLEDPRVNFAITTRGAQKGVDHLGIQVEDDAELAEVYGRLKKADALVIEQGATTCCYAESEKSWIFDPDSIAWETFLTRGASPVYGTDSILPAGEQASACCDRPKAEQAEFARDKACC